jgi:hypothetical protein
MHFGAKPTLVSTSVLHDSGCHVCSLKVGRHRQFLDSWGTQLAELTSTVVKLTQLKQRASWYNQAEPSISMVFTLHYSLLLHQASDVPALDTYPAAIIECIQLLMSWED